MTDELYLIHVIESIERIEGKLGKDGKRIFLSDRDIMDIVLYNLQVMAESVKRITEDIKLTESDIAWKKIHGFRNILVHEYLGLDPEIIWNVIEFELPQLKQASIRMLALAQKDNHDTAV